ncbi:MAG TPA: lysophospholipid acyltransferase family protein, partial [Alphaproteobacteria bacterium]|nr:lysophospholipid acyltransferase family protein [Alphaproteobacteria bacterium]
DLKRFTLKGIEHVNAVRSSGKPAIFVGAHMANWELGPIVTAAHGVPLAVAYRRPNNPFVASMLDYAREAVAPYRMPKGPQGGLALMRHLKKGGYLGLLIDQKLNEGLRLNFFGLPAMTAPAAAAWALRLKAPIFITLIKRRDGARFEIAFENLPLPADDTPKNVAAIMQTINNRLEAAIREAPGQWLWLHRRWVED